MVVTKEDMDWFLNAMQSVLDATHAGIAGVGGTMKTLFTLAKGALRG
jgi:hypothetical protein